jgi:hypothetical protein
MGHSVPGGASLLFGESSSMAAEAAVLGVPAIFIDNSGRGYTRELEREHGLIFNFSEDDPGKSSLKFSAGVMCMFSITYFNHFWGSFELLLALR